MKSLLSLLPVMMRLSGDQEEVCEQASFAAWRAITGGQLSQTCQPFRLYRNTLVVAVADETWKRQMESICRELIFKINSLLEQPLVTFIEFRVDPEHVARVGNKRVEPRAQPVGAADADLLAAASGIKDDELRSAFLKAAQAALAVDRE